MNNKNEYCLPSVRLTSGVGNPETGGCWMAALTVYEGSGWSDHPRCVDEPIRKLCIIINDILPDDAARGRVIGPMLFDPIGTSGNTVHTKERTAILVAAAFNVFASDALAMVGLKDHAEKLRHLDVLKNPDNAARAAWAAAAAARTAAGSSGHSVETYVIKRIIPVLTKMLAVGDPVLVEPSYNDVNMKKCLQLV